MGLEMDFEKNCSSDLSPNTVLPLRHCSKVAKRNANGKLTHIDDISRIKEGFRETSFHRCCSSSCKNLPSRLVGLEGDIQLKRGSIYQSSREVGKMKKMGSNEGRRKIELSRASDTYLSFRIVDSLCSSDKESTQNRSPSMSSNSNLNSFSVQKPCVGPCSSDGFIEIRPKLDQRKKQSVGTVGSNLVENLNFRCGQVAGPLNDGNELLEKDMALTFQKSHSAKVEMPHLPSPTNSEFFSEASSKSRFSPIRKMFDPFVKSKSLRSPLGYIAEPSDVKTTSVGNMRKNQNFWKSLHDFSHPAQKSDSDSQLVNKDHHLSAMACSPVHLHGCLKLENKQGMPFFEFSLNCPEEAFMAKTWKANNAFNSVYTFHSICGRKKSNASSWGLIHGNKESLMVGQMQVSCYFCSEFRDGGAFDNFMVTEFVLYDIAHARQGVSSQDSPEVVKPPNVSSPALVHGTHELDDGSDGVKAKHQQNGALDSGNFDSFSPFASAVLHPDLEIAAIVIQLPFSKRESLTYSRGDKSGNKMPTNLRNLAMVDQGSKEFLYGDNLEKVRVVIPTGNHSLPSAESRGPCSLLGRWRLGGGCDCGGWDMGCPLTVLSNPANPCAADQPVLDKQQPLELFVQGTKENIPALTMTVVEEGQYVVDFHARLSALQAFSICVAILHGTEASSATGEERSKQLPHCNSLKMLIEEEVKFLIEAVTEEEKRKMKGNKPVEEIQRSYVPNPPFSPITRV